MAIAQFSGVASGIDSKSLIDALIEARQVANDKRRNEIDFIEKETEAFNELKEKLLKLDDLIVPFRTSSGGGVTKTASSTDPTVATAVAGSTASNASYALDVTSVANSATASFNQTYGAVTDTVSAGSGNVTILVGQGSEQKTITAAVTNTTTVQQLVDALNSDSDSAGRFVASAVNVGTTSSPSYKIVFNTLKSGTEQGEIGITADAGLTELQATEIEQATDAVFEIGGILGTITRSSNSVSDVIAGVTFNLSKAGTSSITVGDDPSSTVDKVAEIVTAFNDIVAYINERNIVSQDASSRDKTITFEPLAKTRLDDQFLSSFRDKLAAATSVSGTAVRSIASMGISTNRDGTISLDEEKLKAAIASDPSGVGEVLNDFADSVSGIDGTIYQYTRFQGFIDNAISSNSSEIDVLNEAIAKLDRQTDKMRERLDKQFANLERVSGELQSKQQALTGILAGLGG